MLPNELVEAAIRIMDTRDITTFEGYCESLFDMYELLPEISCHDEFDEGHKVHQNISGQFPECEFMSELSVFLIALGARLGDFQKRIGIH